MILNIFLCGPNPLLYKLKAFVTVFVFRCVIYHFKIAQMYSVVCNINDEFHRLDCLYD